MKRLLGSTFLSIFSLVLILMLAEVLLWQLSLKTQIIKSDRWIFAMSRIGHGCFQLDKKTIYRPIPNKGTDGCWQTDTHGFRITPTLNQNIELNILFMGDSFTFGHDVGDEETYPYYIQKSLDEEKLPVQVFNGGIAGYGTDQQYVANPPMQHVNDSQEQLTAIKSVGIEPIVVSDEIRKSTTVQYLDSDVSSTRATESTLGASTNDLSITLFLTADPMQTFGNKHMNAKGNKELGLAVYQHLFPTLVSKLSNVH